MCIVINTVAGCHLWLAESCGGRIAWEGVQVGDTKVSGLEYANSCG